MFLQEIDSATKHKLSFLDNLLTWSKAQTGQIEFKPDSYDLDQIVRETIALYKSQLNLKKISLFYSSCKMMVYADRDMLQTILRNLISNAIKFTGESGQIDILCSSDGNYAKIAVRDNGTGISEEICEGLFKPNSQSGSTGSMNKQNSGLGLIICTEPVERHGGHISVNSEPGKGSEFLFSLPYRK